VRLIHNVQYMGHYHILQPHAFFVHGTMASYTLHCDSKVWDGIYKVQVSATYTHVAAVTKAGRLFTWGSGYNGCLGHNLWNDIELRPKQVQHEGFAKLFFVSASAGCYHSAAIDSSGLVPIFCFSTILDIATMQFLLNICLSCYLSCRSLDMTQFILWGIWKE
jgi:hypothetical protein